MNVTKGMNSEMLEERINREIKGYLMDIDIDCFKNINDDYGYDIGDKVLFEIPNRIENTLRKMNVCASVIRINADEFAVVLKNLSHMEVENIAKSIIASMKPECDFGDVKINVSVSIGIAKFNINESKQGKQSALDAMYKAKKDGKNTYSFY